MLRRITVIAAILTAAEQSEGTPPFPAQQTGALPAPGWWKPPRPGLFPLLTLYPPVAAGATALALATQSSAAVVAPSFQLAMQPWAGEAGPPLPQGRISDVETGGWDREADDYPASGAYPGLERRGSPKLELVKCKAPACSGDSTDITQKVLSGITEELSGKCNACCETPKTNQGPDKTDGIGSKFPCNRKKSKGKACKTFVCTPCRLVVSEALKHDLKAGGNGAKERKCKIPNTVDGTTQTVGDLVRHATLVLSKSKATKVELVVLRKPPAGQESQRPPDILLPPVILGDGHFFVMLRGDYEKKYASGGEVQSQKTASRKSTVSNGSFKNPLRYETVDVPGEEKRVSDLIEKVKKKGSNMYALVTQPDVGTLFLTVDSAGHHTTCSMSPALSQSNAKKFRDAHDNVKTKNAGSDRDSPAMQAYEAVKAEIFENSAQPAHINDDEMLHKGRLSEVKFMVAKVKNPEDFKRMQDALLYTKHPTEADLALLTPASQAQVATGRSDDGSIIVHTGEGVNLGSRSGSASEA